MSLDAHGYLDRIRTSILVSHSLEKCLAWSIQFVGAVEEDASLIGDLVTHGGR
jgi:hypothetical protein